MITVEVELVAPHAPRDEALVQELVRLVNEVYAIGEAGLCLEGTTRTTTGEIVEAIRSSGMLAATLDGRLVGCAYVRPLTRTRRIWGWCRRRRIAGAAASAASWCASRTRAPTVS